MERRDKRHPSGRRNVSSGAEPSAKRGAAARRQAPDVVYTQPGPFDRRRFLLRLVTVVAVVLAVVFGLSIFFKVGENKIHVSGNEKYSAWDIAQASGIRTGENLLTLNKAAASSRILRNLPYVDQVRIGIKLPDTVNIEIVELEVVYAFQAADETWWLVSSGGNVVEKTNGSVASEHTRISGVQLDSPRVGQKAKAKELPQDENDSEQPPVTVLQSQRLEAALKVAQAMEENGLIGTATSLDVTRISSMEMLFGESYQILLGDSENMSKKIRFVKGVMENETSGIIDVSFTQKPNEAIHTNFK